VEVAIVSPIIVLILTFVAPIIAGLLLAGIQFGGYRLLRRESPPFFVLFARGLLAFFVIAAVLAVVTRTLPA
jgi:hypothetical protein